MNALLSSVLITRSIDDGKTILDCAIAVCFGAIMAGLVYAWIGG